MTAHARERFPVNKLPNLLQRRRLDFARYEDRELLSILSRTYRNREEALAMLAKSGTKISGLGEKGSTGLLWKVALEEVARVGKLEMLVNAVLADNSYGPDRDELRRLVGKDQSRVEDVSILDPPPPGAWPQSPWPFDAPYTDGRLMGGREHELDALWSKLDGKHLVVALVAPAKSGLTSFLQAGLVHRLRSRGRPTVLMSEPEADNPARELLLGMVKNRGRDLERQVPVSHFAKLIKGIAKQSGQRPVLILDNVKGLFKGEGRAERIGALLNATADQNEEGDFRAVWVLGLPSSSQNAFDTWMDDLQLTQHSSSVELAPLGSKEPAATFKRAIEMPMQARDENGQVPWDFEGMNAPLEELALQLAKQREADPQAPLVDHLQTALQGLSGDRWNDRQEQDNPDQVKSNEEAEPHQVAEASEEKKPSEIDATQAESTVLEPEEPRDTNAKEPVDSGLWSGDEEQAFRERLQETLSGFGRNGMAVFFALVRLTDPQGKARPGRPKALVQKVLGKDGAELLKKMQAQELLVIDTEGLCRLPDNRSAGVLRSIYSDPEATKIYGPKEGAKLLRFRRLIEEKSAAFAKQKTGSTNIKNSSLQAIKSEQLKLVWNKEEQSWLAEVSSQQHYRGQIAKLVAAGIVLTFAIAAAAWWFLKQ